MKKPPFLTKKNIIIFSLFILIGTSAILVRPTQKFIIDRFELVKIQYINQLSNKLQKNIKYESMSPSIFATIDIKNISIIDIDDGADAVGEGDSSDPNDDIKKDAKKDAKNDEKKINIPDVTIKRISIKYDFFELVGMKPIKSVREIKIVSPQIYFDTEKELIDFFVKKKDDADSNIQSSDTNLGKNKIADDTGKSDKKGRKNTMETLLDALPESANVKISEGKVHLKSGSSNMYFSNFSLNAGFVKNNIMLSMEWESETVLSGFTKTPLKLNFPCRLDMDYNREHGIGNISADIKSLNTENFILHNLRFGAEIAENSINLKKLSGIENFDLSLNYNLDEQSLNAGMVFNKFIPETFVTWQGDLNSLNDAAKIELNGIVNFGLKREGDNLNNENEEMPNRLSYDVNLSGTCKKESTMGEGDFELAVSGDNHIVNVKNINLDMVRGKANFKGSINIDTISPRASLVLENFIFTKNLSGSPVSGTIMFNSPSNLITMFCDTLVFGKTELSAFDVVLHKRKDNSGSINGFDLSMQAIRFSNFDSYSDVAISHINTDLSYDSGGREVQLMLALEAFSMADIIEIISAFSSEQERSPLIFSAFNNLIITTEVFASYDFKHIIYNIPRFIAAIRGGNIWSSASLSGTDEFASLTNGKLITKNNTTKFDARADFLNFNYVTFSANVFWMNSSFFVQGNVLDKHNISFYSPQGLNASLNFQNAGVIAGFLILDSVQIPIGNQVLTLNCDSDFRYETEALWKFNLDNLSFNTASNAFGSLSSADFSAHADQDGVKVERININDIRGTLFGDATFNWERITMEDGSTKYENIDGVVLLRDVEGEETLSLQILVNQNFFDAWLDTNNFQLGRILGNKNNYILSGSLGFNKSPNMPWSCPINLTSLTGKFGGADIVLSSDGILSESSLMLANTSINFGTMTAAFPVLNIALDQNTIETQAFIAGTLGGTENINADININAEFSSVTSWLGIAGALKYINGKIDFNNVHFDTVEIEESFAFNFSRYGNVFSLNGGPGDMVRIQMENSGDFFAAFSTPSPILGTVIGVIKNDSIDLRSSNLIINLATLWKYLPVRVINFSGGIVIANVHIIGALNDPQFFGNAIAAGLKMTVPGYVDEDIGPTPAVITMEGDEMVLQPLYTTVGKTGACRVSGLFSFTGWKPRGFEINVEVPEDTPIPINLNISGFVANGSAFGLLNLSSDEEGMKVSGDLTCNEAEITRVPPSEDEEVKEKDSQKSPLIIDILITAGRRVEFLFPNAQFPIVRATATSGAKLSIESDSLAGHFAVNGDINIKSGEMFYFQRSFYIREGVINFNESEINFDPHITARAETRDMTNNDPVTISMIVNDQSLTNFSPTFESTPPLSQMEIFSLMGAKFMDTAGSDSALTPLLRSTTDMLAQFYVVRQFENSVRNLTGLDMFSFRTQAIQNAVFALAGGLGKSSSNSADIPTSKDDLNANESTDLRFGNYIDNTTIYIGKYIGTGLFAQIMVSARYNENQKEFSGISIEPDFTIEFQPPGFNVRWDFMPKNFGSVFEKKMGSIVADNKITVTKKWRLP
ncbi:hypothetical protein FACS1894102_0070 [Spirochaetia bacterium]|nr:hypothetical protein FACS1894102_0070 [Spirochaetia bacterium]